MKARHFLSISDLQPEDLSRLIDDSLAIARSGSPARPLEGKIVGIFFRCSSTRTRTAFSVGALKLGAQTMHYGPNDLQIVTGESIHDTGKVLSGYLDALVLRSNGERAEMEALADQSEMSVINAMSEDEHPTQAIADLVTIKEAMGRLDDIHVLYVGEGNNTTSALALAMSKLRGMQLTVVTPQGYGLPDDFMHRVIDQGRRNGTVITQTHDLTSLPRSVDVVYTTRWQTMGVPKEDLNWREKFEPYRVTPAFMAEVSKRAGTIFLHDLPAIRGNEVVDEVLDGPNSVAFRQAQHKLTSAMAVLSWCLPES
ncbi:MAG TPA: ornithine carbamoyltransferase [Blastocatellia bacterium]|nr:ornithine carbamoyltransferase [Blastocatellia bacterium]